MPRSVEASEQQLAVTKARVAEKLGDTPWVRGIGYGLVDGRPGVILSVAPAGEAAAHRLVDRLTLPAPIEIRVLGPVRKRDPRAAPRRAP